MKCSGNKKKHVFNSQTSKHRWSAIGIQLEWGKLGQLSLSNRIRQCNQNLDSETLLSECSPIQIELNNLRMGILGGQWFLQEK